MDKRNESGQKMGELSSQHLFIVNTSTELDYQSLNSFHRAHHSGNMDEFNWLSIIVTARWSLISLSFLLKISCQCRELNDLWFHSTNRQTYLATHVVGDCVLIPGVSDPCEMPGPSMSPAWDQGLASGQCWHSWWHGDTDTSPDNTLTTNRQR